MSYKPASRFGVRRRAVKRAKRTVQTQKPAPSNKLLELLQKLETKE